MDALKDGQMAFFVAIDDIRDLGAHQRSFLRRGSGAIRAWAPRGSCPHGDLALIGSVASISRTACAAAAWSAEGRG